MTALEAIAVPTAVEPKSKALISPTTTVAPSKMFSSAAVEVTPSRMFSSAAVLVTFVPPISKVVIETSPATVAIPSAKVIKSVSSVCPIVVPLIRTLSISNEPPLINPVVVIADDPVSIVPKPEVIEPESNAPVVTILELPATTP